MKKELLKVHGEYTQFNEYGTQVVPVKKPLSPGQKTSKMRVCGDYSVTVTNMG